jgi:O-acetyl-ADP-ribose deacetylase (regulator of RNase III)
VAREKRKMKSRAYQFGKSSLTIKFGNITTSDAEAIVSSDDSYISMGGGVSASILRAGGQEIMIDAAKKVPANVGDVIVTTAGRLQARYVFHAITIGSDSEELEDSAVLRKTVTRCFDLLDVLGLHSIAFPAIGAGVAGFSYEDVAVEMANIVATRLTACKHPLDVTVFLYDRFGRMEPIDFIQFFEEFRARVPLVAAREIPARTEQDPPVTKLKEVAKPAEPIARRQSMLTAVSQLTEERALLEDKLAGMAGAGDVRETLRMKERLSEIQDQRVKILTDLHRAPAQAVFVFTSYAHEDQNLLEQLKKHLSPLKRLGVIQEWYDREIKAGTEWRGQIDENLDAAHLILLLISPDFMDSNYCYDVEAKRALQRHEGGDARVIPVILRPVMWLNTPFSKLQALPREGRPVTTWGNLDSALLDVVEGIRDAIDSIIAKT